MIKFLLQGSGEEPYETIFDKEGDRVTATCSCPECDVEIKPGTPRAPCD
jgi:hypothetical protein